VELLSLIPSLLLVQLFRRIRPRDFHQQKVSPMFEAMIKTKENASFDVSGNKHKRSKITFPWWVVFLAYFFSIALVGVSILLIIARSIELRDLRTQKWLTSVFVGFFSSICLSQPLKVNHFVYLKMIIRIFRFYVWLYFLLFLFVI
jgi:hypothetical protein